MGVKSELIVTDELEKKLQNEILSTEGYGDILEKGAEVIKKWEQELTEFLSEIHFLGEGKEEGKVLQRYYGMSNKLVKHQEPKELLSGKQKKFCFGFVSLF